MHTSSTYERVVTTSGGAEGILYEEFKYNFSCMHVHFDSIVNLFSV